MNSTEGQSAAPKRTVDEAHTAELVPKALVTNLASISLQCSELGAERRRALIGGSGVRVDVIIAGRRGLKSFLAITQRRTSSRRRRKRRAAEILDAPFGLQQASIASLQ